MLHSFRYLSMMVAISGLLSAAAVCEDRPTRVMPSGDRSAKSDSSAKSEAPSVLINKKAEGYRSIWYWNQKLDNEYAFKYSGGMGTYCAKHRPFAIYSPEADKTFFCYGGSDESNSTLYHMVSYFDHKTKKIPRPTILLNKRTRDAHDNPVISLDDKGYIWIFSSSHGTSRPSYISVSTKPYCTDEFRLVSKTNFSYPQPFHLSGHGFLFPHTKYVKGRRTFRFIKSHNGEDWSAPIVLADIERGHYQIAEPFGDKKIASAFNFHPNGKGLNWRTNLYYIESDDGGDTWKTVDGKQLTLPLKESDTKALVKNYQEESLNVYLKDLTFDSNGNPIILYITSLGWESGPENGPRLWKTAYWTGKQWDIRDATSSDSNYDMGSLYVEKDNTWRLIAPSGVGPQAFNPGGEVMMWKSSDCGKHWTKVRQLTRGSKHNHTYVRRPLNAHPDFYAIWADGHGRKKGSDCLLYFANQAGDKVYQLPLTMDGDFESPILVHQETHISEAAHKNPAP